MANFDPSYSDVKYIVLENENNSNPFTLNLQNEYCRFERLEMVENINDPCPTGAIVLVDFADFMTLIVNNKFDKVKLVFNSPGSSPWEFDITSVSYANNAASSSDDTLIQINFSNKWYKKFSSNSLNHLLTYQKPKLFTVTEFIEDVKLKAFGIPVTTNTNYYPYLDDAINYFLYKPFNPYGEREEYVSDDVLEIMNYASSLAIDSNKEPNFFFWTGLDGTVNFKSFKRDLTKDDSYSTIENDYRRIAVYDGDVSPRELPVRSGFFYRKAYFLATNPALHWITKNYYYIRKTPKYLDYTGLSGSCGSTGDNIKNLMFHFHDDGQRYNIDVITMDGRNGLTGAPKGGQALVPEYSWGYYDKTNSPNYKSTVAVNGNQFGYDSSYKTMSLMGGSGYMPYLDSADMWKNMFNLTSVHPHYPDQANVSPLPGQSNLQKVIDIRYKVFENIGTSGGSADNLETLRNIEMQNFVMYSLCCMGKKIGEDCFFAMLQKYEEDNSIVEPITNNKNPRKYRYKWNKLNFGPAGLSGSSGYCSCGDSGSSGATGAHILEKWCLDPSIKSSETQDDTWAINVNERGATYSSSSTYYPPGWLPPAQDGNFFYRPIGGKISPPPTGLCGEYINHIVRLCRERVDANNTIYFFSAENVVDGTCSPSNASPG